MGKLDRGKLKGNKRLEIAFREWFPG